MAEQCVGHGPADRAALKWKIDLPRPGQALVRRNEQNGSEDRHRAVRQPATHIPRMPRSIPRCCRHRRTRIVMHRLHLLSSPVALSASLLTVRLIHSAPATNGFQSNNPSSLDMFPRLTCNSQLSLLLKSSTHVQRRNVAPAN